MQNYLIVGASSWTGKVLAHKNFGAGHYVYATFGDNPVVSVDAGLQYHNLNILYDTFKLDFLLSDKSSWITGQVIHVDGGISSLK